MKKRLISMVTLAAMCAIMFTSCAARHGAPPPPPTPAGAPGPPSR
ncbi:MAG TPA: hypothetical protein VJ844_06820 [Mucilaginibacter sp.]|nr:hypothetical protein [Mucilaginibacter sp.]